MDAREGILVFILPEYKQCQGIPAEFLDTFLLLCLLFFPIACKQRNRFRSMISKNNTDQSAAALVDDLLQGFL